MNKTIIRQSEQVYEILLKLYPQNYRQEFGEEMKYIFSESLQEAYTKQGGQGILHLWARTVVDAGTSLVIQHLESQKGNNAVKTNNPSILLQNRNILLIALVTMLILLVPWAAMQYSNEVNWTLIDFLTAGALLFGTGLAFELVSRKVDKIMYRVALGAALLTALLLVWSNLAVGILGAENNPANWMYVGVLAVLVTGALLARFQPWGMARALFATALAQGLVTVIALLTQQNLSVFEILIVNGFFAALWVGSALLFLRANRQVA